MLNHSNDLLVGSFYIADFLIRKVDTTTKIITNFVGNRNNVFSGDNGPAFSSRISS
jgi:hypothetical protein